MFKHDYLCSIELVESIPENLTYPEGSYSTKSTFDAWMFLLNNAKTTLDMTAFYWTLQGSNASGIDPTDYMAS